jgi:hypothetical protein
VRIADLGCGVGGAAYGLHLSLRDAEITGFDVVDQPNYPFMFVKQDALTVDLSAFDFVWASMPCQRYAKSTPAWARENHPDLITPMRSRLIASGLPYVMENVDGAPIRKDLTLCGQMFPHITGKLFRHRHFESNFPMRRIAHPQHRKRVGWGYDDVVTVAGAGIGGPSDLYTWQKVMGISWAQLRHELAQAVPPMYSMYIADEYLAWKSGVTIPMYARQEQW